MRCAGCEAENPDGARFCIECGAAFALPCSACGHRNPARARYCAQCGRPLFPAPTHTDIDANRSKAPKGAATEILAARLSNDGPASVEGERKTVTALFADIKGSMELIEDLDPEEARAIVDPALN